MHVGWIVASELRQHLARLEMDSFLMQTKGQLAAGEEGFHHFKV